MCNIYKLPLEVREDQNYESSGEKKWVGISAREQYSTPWEPLKINPTFMWKASSYTSRQEEEGGE